MGRQIPVEKEETAAVRGRSNGREKSKPSLFFGPLAAAAAREEPVLFSAVASAQRAHALSDDFSPPARPWPEEENGR